ncbi:hypothetical protein [Streptomyces sp. NPDC059142]|uniref:hypothetical protein n=1 Tax=Streptomyces sp. NPDC059142 TaxID=3346739 RepID=UPI003682CC00
MINVISTNEGSDVSEEYAERVEALLRSSGRLRETTQHGRLGETALTIRLYAYAAPGTEEPRWAVDYEDGASRELEEYDSLAEADARYEEMVRDVADRLREDHEGVQERFSATDVEGVPGPLPELPGVDMGDVETLLDQPSQDPVLYVEREGDEVRIAYGPAAQVPSGTVLLTRDAVLEELSLSDTPVRFTSQHLDEGDRMMLDYLAHRAQAARRAAVSMLFVPSTD